MRIILRTNSSTRRSATLYEFIRRFKIVNNICCPRHLQGYLFRDVDSVART